MPQIKPSANTPSRRDTRWTIRSAVAGLCWVALASGCGGGATASGTTAPAGGTDTPPGTSVTPPGTSVTPPSGTVTPPGTSVTPPGGTVTPPGGSVTPPGTSVPPPGGVTLSATVLNLHTAGLTLSSGTDTRTVPMPVDGSGSNTADLAGTSITVDFASKLVLGSPYNVHIAAEPRGFTDVCDMSDGSGFANTLQVHVTALCHPALAVVTTFAGSNVQGYIDDTGRAARFWGPSGVATDAKGNLYVADSYNYVVRKITPAGVVSTLAGSGKALSVDGDGREASFYGIADIAVDAAGVIYVAESYSHKIRKITPTGVVTTLAGSSAFGSADGAGTSASFYGPHGIVVDGAGNLFVADSGNHVIRKISPSGAVSTFAGSGIAGADNGQGRSASFHSPMHLAVDSAGTLYVSDTYNHMIRKITAAGVVTTLAGTGRIGADNGTARAASFRYPNGIALDRISGTLYIADSNRIIRKISSTGFVTTLAGTDNLADNAWRDGIGTAANFIFPVGVALNAAGEVFVTDSVQHTIRKIVAE
jgi:sugar lactone lactonase YvrE